MLAWAYIISKITVLSASWLAKCGRNHSAQSDPQSDLQPFSSNEQ